VRMECISPKNEQTRCRESLSQVGGGAAAGGEWRGVREWPKEAEVGVSERVEWRMERESKRNRSWNRKSREN
jgi:hypothetical protein